MMCFIIPCFVKSCTGVQVTLFKKCCFLSFETVRSFLKFVKTEVSVGDKRENFRLPVSDILY